MYLYYSDRMKDLVSNCEDLSVRCHLPLLDYYYQLTEQKY